MNTDYLNIKSKSFTRIAIALTLGGFAVFSNLHMTQPILPMLSKDIGISPTAASLTVSIVTFTLSIFLLVFGPLSDAFGRKSVMALGLLFTAISSILIFFVGNFTTLLMLRALQGVALAALPAVAYAYIGEEFEPQSVGIIIGLYISSNSVGGMGGRILSGFFADMWGWRYSFLMLGLIGLIIFALFVILLPNSKHFQRRPFSIRDAARQYHSHLSNPTLRYAYYIAGIIFFIFLGLFNYLGYYLHGTPYELPTSIIGFLYVTYLAGTYSSTLSGKLDGRISIPVRIRIGLILMFIGMLLMLVKPLVIIILGLLVISFGFFFAHSASSSWVSKNAQTAKASASALYLFSYYVGGAMGSTVLGFIWEKAGWEMVIAFCLFAVLVGGVITFKMQTQKSSSAL